MLSDAGLFSKEPTLWWQGPAPLAVVSLDVDGDGDLDLIAMAREGSNFVFSAVLNDGSGQFDKLINNRLTGKASSSLLDLKFAAEDHDPSKAPRMVKLNNGVAFCTSSALYILTISEVTSAALLFSGSTSSIDVSGTIGGVLDMKAVNLNGQPGANQDDLVVLTGNGHVHIRHTTGGSAGTMVPLPLVSLMTNPQRIGVGNILGDPPRSTASLHGMVNNAGAIADASQVDPRSHDIVVCSGTTVYVLPGALYDPNSPTWSSAGTDWIPVHTFDSPTSRVINALEVADIDGNGQLPFSTPTLTLTLTPTNPFLNQHTSPTPNQAWPTSFSGLRTRLVPSTAPFCTPRQPCLTPRVRPTRAPFSQP